MSSQEEPLAKVYSPADVEQRWYAHWEQQRFFAAAVRNDRDPYAIVIPPPNITGVLHMGHILNNTLQDAFIRYRRMTGYEACWIPGTDHAGIATQNVVERSLIKEGKTRHDLGREKFIERVWEWKKQYGGTIIRQLRTLGSSCDWDREKFTMDETLSAAVREVFVRLYEEGLIYRGKYIVNWCPKDHTAISDDEVNYAEQHGQALLHPLSRSTRSRREAAGKSHRRDDPARDDARRHRRGGEPRGRAVQTPGRPDAPHFRSSDGRSRSSPTTSWNPPSARAW